MHVYPTICYERKCSLTSPCAFQHYFMEIPISCTERSSDDNERLEVFQTKKKQIESILHFALNQNWLCAFASTMSSAHNAPYGPGCWHSLNGRSHRKSSLVFKDLGMALQKCHLSMPSLSKIARKIPGNRLWNCRAQFSQPKAAQQHLPTGTVKNEKPGAFNGASKYSFS